MQTPRALGRALMRTVLALALLAPASASGAVQVAVLTVRVNEDQRGEIPVVLRGADVLIPTEQLGALWLEGVARRGRREFIEGREYVSLASLSPALSFRMDEQELALNLHTDPSMLPATKIDLRPTAPAGIDYRRDTSLFVNYAPRLLEFRAVDAHGEAGLSTSKGLFWSAASYSPTRGLVRGLSSATFDDRTTLRRIVVGDAFSSGGALGGGVHAGGITVSKNFDLDPYFVRGPTLGASTLALTPSQLDVYVNGVLVRQQPVAPGPVHIQNLQGQSGAGVARYVLRDVFGREQALASPFYLSNGILRASVDEYTYTVGVKREQLGLSSLGYTEPVALARHRVGLTSTTTVGGRFEMGSGAASTGATYARLTPYGLLDLALGASHAGGSGGFASAASYSFQSPGAGLGVLVQTLSPRYATTSLAPDQDRPLFQANVFASLSLGRRLNLGAQHAAAYHRDAGLHGLATLLSSYQIAPGITLLATFNRRVSQREGNSTDGMLTLSFNIDRTSAQLSAQARSRGSNQAIASVSRPLPRAQGYGYRTTATFRDQAIERAQGTAEYQGNHGAYAVSYEMERRSDQVFHHAILSTRGAVVWIPGVGVFATRPVGQAIGVLRLPGIAGVRGYLNNQEIGRTDRDGNLLIPDLLPYYANRVRLADEDLPLSHLIEETEKLVAPPFRGAAVAHFTTRRSLFFRGTILVQGPDGSASPPAYGDLRVSTPQGTVESPIGKQGEIELDGLQPGSYQAEILHKGEVCRFPLQVPDAPGPIVDLGTLRCTQP
jgi:outer membrane usher protein